MKWLPKKIETLICIPTFIIGMYATFVFEDYIMAIGFLFASIAYVRLLELYIFDDEFMYRIYHFFKKKSSVCVGDKTQ